MFISCHQFQKLPSALIKYKETIQCSEERRRQSEFITQQNIQNTMDEILISKSKSAAELVFESSARQLDTKEEQRRDDDGQDGDAILQNLSSMDNEHGHQHGHQHQHGRQHGYAHAHAYAHAQQRGRAYDHESVTLPYNFSDESVSEDDKYNTVSDLLSKSKRALIAGGGMPSFQKNLARKLHVLHGTRYSEEESALKLEDEMQAVVLNTWTDEVLRFLVLKTITGDNTEPCQLLPGYAVGVGWKVLMLTPSLYSKVCLAMGNQDIFDHNPSDTATNRIQEKHKVKRYNATLRAYECNFDNQQPPNLYWNFHPKKLVEEDWFLTSVVRQCGVDMAFLSDPFAMEQKTKEPGMSPSMPSLF